MQETPADFCLRHGFDLAAKPEPMPFSDHAWLAREDSGAKWVIKSISPADNISEVLKNFSLLHPPFRHPRPISDPGDAYLLYPCIEGRSLTDGIFERPEVIDSTMEAIGRLQALTRSLVLVPFYQDTLRLKEPQADTEDAFSGRFNRARIHAADDRQKSARHREIVESLNWTQARARHCHAFLRSHGLWPAAPLEAFQEQLRNLFSIHLPVIGNNLAHTALHPEHLLFCPDGQIGIVGWHLEPRPRFYMVYTYLAWGFMHSARPDCLDFYREFLKRNSSRAFHAEHHLVFALCLVEQMTRSCAMSASGACHPPAQKLQQAGNLFSECITNLQVERSQ